MSISAETTTELKRLRDEIRRGARIISLGGLTSIAAKAFVLSTLQRETGKTFTVVTESNKELETWNCDLDFWCDAEMERRGDVENKSDQSPRPRVGASRRLLSLPAFETDAYSGISPHAETQEERALSLWRLTQEKPAFVLASAKSLITKTPAPQEIKNYGAFLKRDEDFAPERLIETLAACGYVREEPIYNYGQFSMRGGIIDVWSPDAEKPVRIEFFGDTVDSIREFDAETQLSVGQLKEIRIAPMREFCAAPKDFKDWAFFARERFADERFARNLKDRTDFAEMGETFSGWEFLIALTMPRESSLFDYLKDAVFVIDEPPVVEQTLGNFYETLDRRYREVLEADDIGLEPRELFLTPEELRDCLEKNQRLELRALGRTAAETDEEFAFDASRSVPPAVAGGFNSSGSNASDYPSATADGSDLSRPPLFLFSTAEKTVELEIQSRSTRKFHGNLREFANEIKNGFRSSAFGLLNRRKFARHCRKIDRNLARLRSASARQFAARRRSFRRF
jgi:transcription-repair coupling factor (superfamily II helicase)